LNAIVDENEQLREIRPVSILKRLRRWYRNVHAHDHGGWGDLTPRKGCYCQEPK
jgi:hypothetical protein